MFDLQGNANLIREASKSKPWLIEHNNQLAPSSCNGINPGTKFQIWMDDAKEALRQQKQTWKSSFVKNRISKFQFFSYFISIIVVAMAVATLLKTNRFIEMADHHILGDYDIFKIETGESTIHSMEEALKVAQCNEAKVKNLKNSRAYCLSQCTRMKSSGTRYVSQQACIAGCEDGKNIGWEMGCDEGFNAKSNTSSKKNKKGSCDYSSLAEKCKSDVCISFRNMYPRPSVQNQCTAHCTESAIETCLQARDFFVERGEPASHYFPQ